jgi:YggT family protein
MSTQVIGILLWILQIYSWILLARAILSWIPNIDPYNPAVRILYQITEPVLQPIRKLVPPLGGVMDISMIIAFFALYLLRQLIISMV